MDRKSVTGLLNSLFNFKKLPDGSVDKSKVQCSICLKEFNYHLSTASLSYHLQAKHPGVAPNASQLSKTQLRQSTILECGSCCRPLDESTSKKLTTAIARWVATDCRPVNIVEDSGLRDVIRLACSDPAYTFLIWNVFVFDVDIVLSWSTWHFFESLFISLKVSYSEKYSFDSGIKTSYGVEDYNNKKLWTTLTFVLSDKA